LNELRTDLRAIQGDGMSANVMVGVGEYYLPAFVLAVSASQVASGLVATVPLVIGSLLQLVSPHVIRYLRSYRRWVIACVVLQALSFLPLLAGAIVGSMPVALVFTFASIYWASGLAAGPAWNAWVDALVPERIRARFFAGRNLWCQLGLVAGFVAGGMALQMGTWLEIGSAMFALLFLIATGSRLVSAGYLKRQRETNPPAEDVQPLGLHSLLGALGSHATGRMLMYFLVVQTAVQISGPYFTPYMLRQLELSYAGYMALCCVAFVSRIVFLPAIGRLADRFGADRLLWIGGVAIVPVAALWCVSDSFAWLCFAQVVSGAAWAAYELATLLLFFESIPSRRRVNVLTVFNLANSTAILAGSLIGGALLISLGAGREAYLTLFIVSSSARALALVMLARLPVAARAQRAVAAPRLEQAPQMSSRSLAPHSANGHVKPALPLGAAPVYARLPEREAEVSPFPLGEGQG
jgi:MFS family permease